MSRLEFFDVLNLPDYFFLLPEDFFEMKAQSEAGSQPRGRGVGMEKLFLKMTSRRSNNRCNG